MPEFPFISRLLKIISPVKSCPASEESKFVISSTELLSCALSELLPNVVSPAGILAVVPSKLKMLFVPVVSRLEKELLKTNVPPEYSRRLFSPLMATLPEIVTTEPFAALFRKVPFPVRFTFLANSLS